MMRPMTKLTSTRFALLTGAALALSACAIDAKSAGNDPFADAGVDGAADTATDGSGSEPTPGLDFSGVALFGDLHSHSTNSIDVYILNSPLLDGTGQVTAADHCAFARHCADLDFWAITDHQTYAPPEHWLENLTDVQACNDDWGGETSDPTMVTFIGYEWQQSHPDPELNYAHKNVLFRDIDPALLPSRPITTGSQVTQFSAADIELITAAASGADPDNVDVYDDIRETVLSGLDTPACDPDVPSTELSPDCMEFADTPAELYERLSAWGAEALVMPHGSTWGQHHVPGSSWEYQLNPDHHDPSLQRLIEVYSSHGSGDAYRPWRPGRIVDGEVVCPDETADFLPCCQRAAQLVRANEDVCTSGGDAAACDARVAEAQRAFLEAGRGGILTLDYTTPDDWLDCNQCRDCFQPTEGYRPLFSTQAALARTWFGEDGSVLRYTWGFIGSTDTHARGPGAGYKEMRELSDIWGPGAEAFDALVDLAAPRVFPEWERQNSYYYAGALVGVYARDRSREAIWEALRERRTWATSGERIDLVFAVENGPDGAAFMGSEVAMAANPRFVVRATGAPVQAPGCPDATTDAVGAEFVEAVCRGECFHPTGDRHPISRIEVVRVTPQITPDESIEDLIEDPWLVLDCDPADTTCEVSFEDELYAMADRPATYYVRAIQEPSMQLNADPLRCERDDDGRCLSVNPCRGGWEAAGDACLSLDEERAWSSPIYLSP